MKAGALESTVIKGGFCIGCGVCAAASESPFVMAYDEYGMLRARLAGEDRSDISFVSLCPFAQEAANEDVLAKRFLPAAPHSHQEIGGFTSCLIGHVSSDEVRMRASSGGIGRWLLSQMLRDGYVDAVVHVRQNAGGASGADLYEYTVTRSEDELLATSRSAYYPVTLAQVIEMMREQEARYAVTGVPCFIKALRLLSSHDEVLRKRIAVAVGIVCGHLKSKAFAENFAWQLGVPPDDLGGIEFRGKLAGLPANHKGVSAYSLNKREWTPPVSSKQLLGGDWGLCLFKYKACDYCDDVFAETADLVIGDAWLPDFVKDSKGSSIIVCRNPDVQRMLEEGVSSGQLVLQETTPEQIVRSQSGGVRHKREGLAYRLAVDDANERWHPPKRIAAGGRLRKRRQRIYETRVALAASSHQAFDEAKRSGDLSLFKSRMQGLIESYQASRVSASKAVRKKVVAMFKRLLRR